MAWKDSEQGKSYMKAYYEAHKEEMKARSKAWREANPDRYRATKKAYYEANKEEHVARADAWNKAHPEKKRQSEQDWRERNPEKVRQQNLRSRSRIDPDTKKARQAAYDAERRDEQREYQRRRYKENTEAVNAIGKKWCQANPEKVRAKNHRRRARKKNAPGDGWTAQDVAMQYMAQRGKCFYCKTDLGEKFHRDHIVPLAHGGHHCKTNLALACASCNLRKHTMTAEEFMNTRLDTR